MITKKSILIFTVITVFVLVMLKIFMPDILLQEPNISPVNYLANIPYWELRIFGQNTIIEKPSETLFVFILGVQTIVLGVSFLKTKHNEKHLWWGISMVFWGIGALLAGTSYQGLGYQLKCVGNDFCQFTSWFELAYLYFTAVSISALAVAIKKTVGIESSLLYYYSLIAIGLYTFILLLGSIIESRFLISYELFTVFFFPLFLLFFVYSVIEYRKKKDTLNKTLITTWILFLIVNVSYYIYYFLGITEILYDQYSIWFSANDILHVLLIGWMAYIQFVLKKKII